MAIDNSLIYLTGRALYSISEQIDELQRASPEDFRCCTTLSKAQQSIMEEPLVYGVNVTPETQCAHYHSPLDIIAIKHKCCDKFYACIDCHSELAGHAAQVWGADERAEEAVMCGNCKHILTITEYLECNNKCIQCQGGFNPGCRNHYDLYFAMKSKPWLFFINGHRNTFPEASDWSSRDSFLSLAHILHSDYFTLSWHPGLVILFRQTWQSWFCLLAYGSQPCGRSSMLTHILLSD